METRARRWGGLVLLAGVGLACGEAAADRNGSGEARPVSQVEAALPAPEPSGPGAAYMRFYATLQTATRPEDLRDFVPAGSGPGWESLDWAFALRRESEYPGFLDRLRKYLPRPIRVLEEAATAYGSIATVEAVWDHFDRPGAARVRMILEEDQWKFVSLVGWASASGTGALDRPVEARFVDGRALDPSGPAAAVARMMELELRGITLPDFLEESETDQVSQVFAELMLARDADAYVAEMLDVFHQDDGPELVGVVSEEIRGDRAVVTVRIRMDGEEEDSPVPMALIQGHWVMAMGPQ